MIKAEAVLAVFLPFIHAFFLYVNLNNRLEKLTRKGNTCCSQSAAKVH